MNKRQKKKIKDKEMNNKALFIINNMNGSYIMYVAKKYWNKGEKDKGFLIHDTTGDYISMGYINNLGFKYFGWINNSCVDIEPRKSWNNKNHLVKR